MNYEEKIRLGKVAKFTKEVRTEIYERDGYKCILCGSTQMLNPHHSEYGVSALVNNSNRNTIISGVTVCQDPCHEEIHGCKKGEGKRKECIDYLDKLYGSNRINKNYKFI